MVDQDDVAGLNPWQAVAIGLAAAAVAVVLRVLFVVPLVALLRQDAAGEPRLVGYVVRGTAAPPRHEEMEPGGTAAGALAHCLEQSGRRGGLMRDDENRCRLLIHELTSEQARV